MWLMYTGRHCFRTIAAKRGIRDGIAESTDILIHQKILLHLTVFKYFKAFSERS